MHRLFVAIELPTAVRDRLLAAMGGVSGARWQRVDQLHLTLRFIGEVDRHAAQDIAAALGGVYAAPFELALRGTETFGRRGVPETLWAAVTPHDAVTTLHAKVDQALRRAGMALEARAYAPHITLARLGRHSGPVAEFVTATALGGPAFTVSGFALYESTLTRDGADYRTVERYSLQG